MKIKRCVAIGTIAVVLSILTVPARAVEGDQGDGGIPSTAVARLKIGKGTAWVRSGDSGQWEEASTNYTLSERSRISVPDGSEAEIQFRGSQSLVLRGGSEVDLRQLGDKAVSYRLRSGKADLSLPKEDFAPVRVKVPGNREVRVDAPGRYAISTDRGTTTFLVRAGEGSVIAEKGPPIGVKAGEEASIGKDIRVGRAEKPAESPAPEMAPEEPLTKAEEQAEVPREVAGELREYGEWVSTPEYGYVWRPYVDDGWEPYYYGRWAWVSPYGWTWVGYEPWGWWPYHTGWWWPSPVFGWVWSPFHSFVSFDFFFGRSVFIGHHARFFPGNVRFVGRGGFVRWVPARPGEIASRSGAFSRGDSRLARWNRPVERGSVMVRRDGGRPVAWEGRGGSSRGAMNGMRSGMPRKDLRLGGSSVSRSRDGGAVRGRQGNYGTVTQPMRQGSTRTPALAGERASRSYGRYSGPVRSSMARVPVSRPGGGSPRGYGIGGSPRGYGSGSSPRGYGSGGTPRGYVGGGSSRGFGGGESRGFGGGFRGSGGGR
ncbi:MAG: hypothetical protein M1377_02925 [Deltaproteobacteria bacterium]|nr:hypothetical protein [Deltaproteobacteria bacterium]